MKLVKMDYMSELKKKILLGGAFIVFFAVSPFLVFFAWGHKIDFQDRQLLPAGGIYLKSTPKKAAIYIGGDELDRTPKFISGLTPKSYSVKLKKEGFKPWKKKMCVRPYKVSIARKILLVPRKPDLRKAPGFEKEADLNRSLVEKQNKRVEDFIIASSSSVAQEAIFEIQKDKKANELVLGGMTKHRLSPDRNKLLYWQGKKAGIFWLRDNPVLAKRERQKDLFNFIMPQNGLWYEDGNHILYEKNSNLYLIGVDDRGGCKTEHRGKRIKTLVVEGIKDFTYNREKNRIFIKRNGEWFSFRLVEENWF